MPMHICPSNFGYIEEARPRSGRRLVPSPPRYVGYCLSNFILEWASRSQPKEGALNGGRALSERAAPSRRVGLPNPPTATRGPRIVKMSGDRRCLQSWPAASPMRTDKLGNWCFKVFINPITICTAHRLIVLADLPEYSLALGCPQLINGWI